VRFALLAVGVLALAACSGGDEREQAAASLSGPGAFALRINTYLRTGQFDLAWQHLHPEQKRIVSQATLASCWTSTTDVLGDPNVRMNVVGVFDEPWRIPGTGLTRPSTAVTVEAVRPTQDGRKPVLEKWTQHTFKTGSGWSWIVAAQFVADVQNDAC
jgi:hypothetical protein